MSRTKIKVHMVHTVHDISRQNHCDGFPTHNRHVEGGAHVAKRNDGTQTGRVSVKWCVFSELELTFIEEPYKSMAERESGSRSTKNSLFGVALLSSHKLTIYHRIIMVT